MLFILHHSKGALLFSAREKQDVIEWSKRQLGLQAGRVSVTESTENTLLSLIEGSGTGIVARSDTECRPLASLPADLSHSLGAQSTESEDLPGLMIEQGEVARQPVWH